MAKREGTVRVLVDRCKGCGLCIDVCPTHSLSISPALNHLGYHPVEFLPGTGCTACSVCYYACPEPAALAVFRSDEGAA
jgi:Pyruvate/2-oxoacid:ferredoxin oxidoreductase delta subunit